MYIYCEQRVRDTPDNTGGEVRIRYRSGPSGRSQHRLHRPITPSFWLVYPYFVVDVFFFFACHDGSFMPFCSIFHTLSEIFYCFSRTRRFCCPFAVCWTGSLREKSINTGTNPPPQNRQSCSPPKAANQLGHDALLLHTTAGLQIHLFSLQSTSILHTASHRASYGPFRVVSIDPFLLHNPRQWVATMETMLWLLLRLTTCPP